MSIRWLQTFIAVAQCGSFASGANKIGLTQAAVSVQMNSLEEKLRVKLFDRTGRATVLNTAGRALLPKAQEVVALYEHLGDGLHSNEISGNLSIGAIHHIFSQLLPDALILLRDEHPNIIVNVCNGLSADLMTKVEQGELDAAIVSEPAVRLTASITWNTIVSEPLALIGPAGADLANLSRALEQYPFISLNRLSWTGQLTHALARRHRLKLNEVLELNSSEAIAAMVARGYGISILPLSSYIWALQDKVAIARLTQPSVHRKIGLIHRTDQANAEVVSVLHSALLRSVFSRESLPVVSEVVLDESQAVGPTSGNA